MALTRKLLKGMGLTEEQIDTIIEAHTETVDGLKDKVENYKADADKLEKVQKELDGLKSGVGGEWQKKYEKEHSDFEAYKEAQTAKETKAAKADAVRDFYKSIGISEKRLDAVMKVTDLDSFELDKDGKIKDAEKRTEDAKAEWADFIVSTDAKGADTKNPPASNPKSDDVDLGTLSMEDYIAARQKKG